MVKNIFIWVCVADLMLLATLGVLWAVGLRWVSWIISLTWRTLTRTLYPIPLVWNKDGRALP